MPFPLSRSVKNAITPPIPRAQAWAASYPATLSKPLLNLSQGVPGDPPHPKLRDALRECAGDPRGVGYGPILGEEGLRRAVGVEMERLYRFRTDGSAFPVSDSNTSNLSIGEEGTLTPQASNGTPEKEGQGPPTWQEIAITSGCNQAFFDVMMSVCERGDGVVLPVPWYFNMLMTFQILGITPLPLALDATTGFLPSLSTATEILNSPQGDRAKAIVLVSPNNPTGTTYPPELIEGFADLARERGVALIVDETYRDFIVPDSGSGPGRPHTLFDRPDWRSHVISLASFSKSYKIPGHRLGVIVAGKEVLQAVTTVADCIQICAPRPPQLALAPLLPALRTDLAETSARIHARLELFTQLITPIRGWRVVSKGGFYAYVQHPYIFSNGEPVASEQVSEILATRCGILTLPGAFFMPERGSDAWRSLEDAKSPLVEDKWIRFAIANVSDDVVREVPERLEMLNGIMQNEHGCRIAE